MSLEQIVLAQKDEPDQTNCIFKVKKDAAVSGGGTSEKFYQIRIKSINFFQKQATAVYMYDITNQIQALELG